MEENRDDYEVFYSTYSSKSSRCSMGIVSSNTLKKKGTLINLSVNQEIAKCSAESKHSANKMTLTENRSTGGSQTFPAGPAAVTAESD